MQVEGVESVFCKGTERVQILLSLSERFNGKVKDRNNYIRKGDNVDYTMAFISQNIVQLIYLPLFNLFIYPF